MLFHITRDQWERIPEAYKAEGALTTPGRKACFICFLTKAYSCAATSLCFENMHFKITEKEERPKYTRVEEANGGHAVQCLKSEAAKEFYQTGKVKVYEYHNPEKQQRLFRWILYAYQWRGEYADDLTELELAARLEEIKRFEETEAAGKVALNMQPGSYNCDIYANQYD